jgi:uncharacterized protein with HEPN domain
MPSKKLISALYDIRDSIARARRFSDGLTFEQFCENEMAFHATTRMLEVISEASRRLCRIEPEVCERNSSIPWRDILDAGNFYRHQYDNVAELEVWKTLQTHLSPLLAVTLAEIERAEAQP